MAKINPPPPPEINHCQLEKEILSIVFVCSKFHKYVYIRKFLIENEHKPLNTILAKPITENPPTPPTPQQFNVSCSDTLSRATLKDTTQIIPETKLPRIFTL